MAGMAGTPNRHRRLLQTNWRDGTRKIRIQRQAINSSGLGVGLAENFRMAGYESNAVAPPQVTCLAGFGINQAGARLSVRQSDVNSPHGLEGLRHGRFALPPLLTDATGWKDPGNLKTNRFF